MSDPEEQVRALAHRAVRGSDDDATGWFERLYDLAARGEADVPWDRGAPHPLLVEWAESEQATGELCEPRQATGQLYEPTQPDGTDKTAVVVGCGFGADAELVASRGYATTAFDVSASAVAGARERYPDSQVDYRTADLLALPTEWHRAFDLVVEIMTVQALPRRLRTASTAAVASLVAPGGELIVIAIALGADEDPDDGPPWPLTRAEVDASGSAGLTVREVEERFAEPDIHRWWGHFGRP